MKKAVIAMIGLMMMLAGQAGAAEGAPDVSGYETAIFAGGCFWCMEPPFERLDGVIEVISGYTGGTVVNPTYKDVSSGGTGHTEAIRVVYDPARVTYARLLEVFWRQIDPTDGVGQFVDRGLQYRPGIYYLNEAQRAEAERSKRVLEASGAFAKPIAVEIRAAGAFYDAEEYHQDYYRKNPLRYKFYRSGSGRDRFLDRQWGAGGH